MAANGTTENGSPGIQDPSLKVPKLSENGAAVDHHHLTLPLPLLKVKKLSQNAVLPSRASPLSAGYDLSSAAEAKVPARGKALVPTDLSIAISEGTYARIEFKHFRIFYWWKREQNLRRNSHFKKQWSQDEPPPSPSSPPTIPADTPQKQ